MSNRPSKFKSRIIALIVTGLLLIIGATATFLYLQNSMEASDTPKENHKEVVNTTPPIIPNIASDETLGSGFAITYPKEWTNIHVGATQPESTTVAQTDTNTITSPSGNIQVILKVQTLAQTSGSCPDGYINLKYLKAEDHALPQYSDGRFVAYVVYFPDFNLYQYHVGLQKNTQAIRAVTLDNNTACNFMFSEFIPRASSLPNVPLTTTNLSINFVDLVLKGQNLKAGVNETNVAEKLSGTEYEQAKAIVESLYIK